MNDFVDRSTSRWRVLVAAGALLTSCTNTEAESHTEPAEAVVGEATSALGSTYYEFVANAPGAAWSTNAGGILWGSAGVGGSCKTITGAMENGVTAPYLLTEPKWTAGGFMQGTYTVQIPAASQHPTLTATFGFVQGAATDGATFSIKTQVNGAWVTLFSQTKTYTGALTTKTADLSAYALQTIPLFLRVESGSSYLADFGVWSDVRIVTDSTVPPSGGCTIAGVNWAKGAVNPNVSCQVCDPVASTTAWTIRADSCLIGGQCIGAETTLGWRRCDPLVTQTAWTEQATCENIVVATTTTKALGSWRTSNGPGYPDTICAANGQALGLSGTWKALYSTAVAPVINYKDMVPVEYRSKPVVNLHGEQLYDAWNSIFTNQVWPSNVSMYALNGSADTGNVWTGTSATTGAALGLPCLNWNVSSYLATVGDLNQRKLVESGSLSCQSSLSFACVLIPTVPPAVPGQVTVQNYDGTAEGILQGKPHRNAYAWRGVPYAAAPTGVLRFAPPAKVTAWTGVRNAYTMAANCPQKGFFPGPGYIGSEDCLYLNIWAPKSATATSNLPVFVFHHGGGLMFGGATAVDDIAGIGMYDGDRLAASQNMVVVTLQTRLAALGYLALPELSANATSRTSANGGGTSGNYGLLDGLQALKWIKRNISKFGGDPNHVTLAGQSGGATLVGMLLSSPLAKDPADNKPYFASTFMMSGFYEEPTMATRYTQGTAVLPSLHCDTAADKVACLRSAAVNDFAGAAGDFLMFIPDMLNAPTPPSVAFGLKFGPNIDGYVLPAQPRVTIAAGNHQKVPVIIGGTKKEFSTFMVLAVAGVAHALTTGDINNMVYIQTCADLTTRTNLNLGPTLAAAALPLYPCSGGFYLAPTTAYSDAMTHVQYECPTRRTARALMQGQPPPAGQTWTTPVRRYLFTHNADHPGAFQNLFTLVPQIGAAHALDVPYIFNTHSTVVLGIPTYWPSARELELTKRYGKYIRAFAATGDPNYTGGNAWPVYDRNLDNALSLKVVGETGTSDPGPSMINGIDTSYCDFWDNNFTLDGWK